MIDAIDKIIAVLWLNNNKKSNLDALYFNPQ